MSQERHNKRRIGHHSPTVFVAARAPALRLFFVLLGLLALTVQSLVVQTHIHVGQSKTATFSIAVNGSAIGNTGSSADRKAPSPRDNYPGNEDPSNCPICQAFAHFGQFTHGVPFVIAPPFSITIRPIVFDEARYLSVAVAHFWHGRAPPSQIVNVLTP
jgi:hypothetical protein